MPIDNPFFAEFLAHQIMDEQYRRMTDAPARYRVRELQRRSSPLNRLLRAVRKTP